MHKIFEVLPAQVRRLVAAEMSKTGRHWKADTKPSTSLILEETKVYYHKGIHVSIQRLLNDFITTADSQADIIDIVRSLSALLANLAFFWDWLHDQHHPSYDQYKAIRNLLLHHFHNVGFSSITPCIHYLTNHVWEDYLEWGSLKMLVGEAGEASHARDNHRKWCTCRCRRSGTDRWNTYAVILRNFWVAKELERQGVRDRCVFFCFWYVGCVLINFSSTSHSSLECLNC